jgi:hypothetical protein
MCARPTIRPESDSGFAGERAMAFDLFFNSVFDLLTKKKKFLGDKQPASKTAVFEQAEHSGAEQKYVVDPKRPREQWALPESLHTKIVGGFCNGASLDWLRKVLQRGDDAGRNESFTHLKASRVMRMAQTQVNLNEKLQAARDPKVAQERAKASRLSDEAKSGVSSANQAYELALEAVRSWVIQNHGSWKDLPDGRFSAAPHPEASAEVQAMFNAKWEQLAQAIGQQHTAITRHNELMGQAGKLRDAANALVDQWNTKSAYERRAMAWDDLVKTIGTDQGKRRPFRNICPVASNPPATAASFRDFLISALSTPAFSPGRGMQIKIALEPGPGHAVALHREVGGAVYLFDPNLGVYKFTDPEYVVMTLSVLIELGYAGPEKDGKVTRLGTDHGWQVFARADHAPPQATGPALMTVDDIRLGCDHANDIVESARDAAEYDLGEKLQEAKELHAKYTASKTRNDRVHWHNAHNAAVLAFKRVRGVTLADAQRTYRQLTPEQQSWTEQ